MTGLKRIGFGLVVTYIILCAIMFFAQRKLLYFPPQSYLTPADVGMPDMQELSLAADTTSWWQPPSAPDKKTVMIFHGNGSAVYSNYHIFADLIAQGYGVLSVGYPGYPHKDAAAWRGASQARISATALANYQFLLDQNIGPENIVFYGTSLGSGVAAQLAAKHTPNLLILDAPFNSTLDMGKRRMPFLPVGLLMKDKFESDKAIAGLGVPLIWTHGTKDVVIPISQGQKLFDNYDGPKTAHIIEGGQHTNLWGLGVREIVLAALDAQPYP